MSNVTAWLIVGFVGQVIFTARFVVQWIASEQKRDSVVPVAFWWLSLAGGTALLSYAIFRRDPVIIAGTSARNLRLCAEPGVVEHDQGSRPGTISMN